MASRSYLSFSRLISALTFLSRITGLARDVVLAAWLGNNWVQDRLTYAFAVPNLFRRLFGEGALSASFIPVLSENLVTSGKERAGKLFGNVATLLTVILTVLTLVLLGILVLVWLFGQRSVERRLVVGLTAVMCPYMIFVCLVALFSAMLNCFDRFGLPAFVPIILNAFQIAAVVIARYVIGRWTERQDIQVYAVGVAVLLAGITQLLVMILAVRRAGISWGIDFSVSDRDLRKLLTMVGPVTLGLGVLQFAGWLDNQIILSLTGPEGEGFTLFGIQLNYPLREGSLAAVGFARRLYQFPLGVLAISLATAAFPMFSRYAQARNLPELAKSVSHALEIAIFEGLPSGLGMIALSGLIVAVLFEHGSFTGAHTAQTAHILRMYCLGLWAYCAQHIILRAFYSLQDMLTPLWVMTGTVALNLIVSLSLLWVPWIGAGAFGIGTTIMCSINVIVLSTIFARRFGTLRPGRVIYSSLKVLVVSAVMAVMVYWILEHLSDVNKYAKLAACLAAGTAIFIASCYVMKIEQLQEVLGIPKRRAG